MKHRLQGNKKTLASDGQELGLTFASALYLNLVVWEPFVQEVHHILSRQQQ